jgi:hypothetical protein
MPKKEKRPNQAQGDLLDIFAGYVNLGEYVRFGSSDVPDNIPSGGEDCRAVVLAASTMGSTSLPDIPETIAPDGKVFLVRYFRNHPQSTTPRKVDDVIYWPDVQGNTWYIHSKDSPDHHSTLMSSTDLESLITDMGLPLASKGTLEDYRGAGGFLNFEDPFQGKKE